MCLALAVLCDWSENARSGWPGLGQLQLLTCIWGLRMCGGGINTKSLSPVGHPGMAAAQAGAPAEACNSWEM